MSGRQLPAVELLGGDLMMVIMEVMVAMNRQMTTKMRGLDHFHGSICQRRRQIRMTVG